MSDSESFQPDRDVLGGIDGIEPFDVFLMDVFVGVCPCALPKIGVRLGGHEFHLKIEP